VRLAQTSKLISRMMIPAYYKGRENCRGPGLGKPLIHKYHFAQEIHGTDFQIAKQCGGRTQSEVVPAP